MKKRKATKSIVLILFALFCFGNITFAEPTTIEGEFISQTGISATVFENADNIDSVTGLFKENYAYSPDRYVYGGAFGNSGTIGYITADFIGNYGLSEGGHGNGGAIDNVGIIGDITGDFKGNHILATAWGYGGAISNCGWNANSGIGNINGDFIENYVYTINNNANGGAIDNTTRIESITGDITGNYAASENSYAYGGAISNNGFIGGITGDVKENIAAAGGSNANGGAIANSGEISYIKGSITNNGAFAENSFAYGGAISNSGYIGGITAGYISENFAIGRNGNANGGAIDNEGYIAFISGTIYNNYADSSSYAYGGAISNIGYIENITGESFSSNYAYSQYNNASGGFINNGNDGVIDNIDAREITNNYAQTDMATWEATAKGGAIYNSGEIGNISALSISNNYVLSVKGEASGGAISNNGGTIGTISSPFNYNYAISTDSHANGGAIDNKGKISSIAGSMNSNYVNAPSYVYGGAISNAGEIGNISGSQFNGNYVHSIYSNATGGFLDNASSGVIGNITATYIARNYAKTDMATWNADAIGGAIHNNNGIIGDITATFGENYTQAVEGKAYGGAIANIGGAIGNISGRFESNYAYSANAGANGGAIENYNGSIESIDAHFIGNYVESSYTYAYGGALSNNSYLNIIKGSFTNNGVKAGWDANGGAIDNYQARIDIINADFTGNYTIGSNTLHGGAINNNGNNASIGTLTGNFSGNYVQGGHPAGGAIYNNEGSIEVIEGNFTGNYASNYTSRNKVYGGAIANNGYIGTIKGDFVNNGAKGDGTTGYGSNNSYGGAIYNSNNGTIDAIKGNFLGNYAVNPESGYSSSDAGTNMPSNAYGSAIYNAGTINNINGYFEGNYLLETSNSEIVSSAVHNVGTIKNFTATFNNTASVSYINSITNEGLIENLTLNITNNKSLYTNAANVGTIQKLSGNFVNNFSFLPVGVLVNAGEIGEIVNASFIGNYSLTNSSIPEGTGAIITTTNLNFVADNGITVFQGNYTIKTNMSEYELLYTLYGKVENAKTYDDIEKAINSIKIPNGEKDYNAICVDDQNSKLTFNSKNSGAIIMKDNIRGEKGYDVEITGDGTGVFYMHNDIHDADVSFNNTTVNTINDSVHTYNFNSFSVSGDTKMVVDVDLANEKMDRITAKSYGEHNGNINVVGMNLLTDTTKPSVAIYFADAALKNNVTNGTSQLPDNYQTTLYSPIYKYKVRYDKDTIYDETKGDGGYFVFARGSNSNANTYNPAILSTSANAQAGVKSTQLQTFNQAFQHADTFMNLPRSERLAIKNRNKVATISTDNASNIGVFSPLLTHDESAGYWIKPYAIFENVPFKNGPKVQNISYGTLIGFDGALTPIKNGWDRVVTNYIGYNGSTQYYNGVDTYQNGGLFGATLTLYKDHFFNATTISTGASVGESHNMYGEEIFTSLLAGVGNKTGYNFEFFDGNFIVQPSVLLSYTFINTFDYTNAAGVRINSDPMHSIQVAPGIKFIGNTKTGWQPYLAVNMVWDILAHSQVKANDVELPEMSIKPYVQYGLGIQRRFNDKFMAFFQAMVQNGGRNGIALSAGFRYAIGKGHNKEENSINTKKIIKENK